ncbi:MAG: DUF4168 domain-containing protein [Nodosilinea sp.]
MVKLIVTVALVALSCLWAGPVEANPWGGNAALLPLMAQVTEPATIPMAANEIATFAEAYQAIQTIKQGAEGDMVKAVESAGLTVEQFNTLAENQLAETAPQPAPESVARATPENEPFDAAVAAIIGIRQLAETSMADAIEATGLSVERFNQILEQAAEDVDLRSQISAQLKS